MGANLFIYAVEGFFNDYGDYKYYAAVRYKAAGRCVRYEGYMVDASNYYFGGRDRYDNCGG